MTQVPSNKAISRAAQLIGRRIYELQSRKNQAEIAAAAGFRSPGMISMIVSGKAKLPIERAVSLARALECDPVTLVRLALEQTLSPTLLAQIFTTSATALTSNEQAIVEQIRDLSAGSDPELTEKLEEALGSALDPTSLAPSRASSTVVAAMLLVPEVQAAQRELANMRQFITSASVRADRVEMRLKKIRSELDQMSEITRGTR